MKSKFFRYRMVRFMNILKTFRKKLWTIKFIKRDEIKWTHNMCLLVTSEIFLGNCSDFSLTKTKSWITVYFQNRKRKTKCWNEHINRGRSIMRLLMDMIKMNEKLPMSRFYTVEYINNRRSKKKDAINATFSKISETITIVPTHQLCSILYFFFLYISNIFSLQVQIEPR